MKAFGRFGSIVLMAAILGLQVSQARAEFIVDITQDGPNVVATGTGTIDLTGLTLVGPNFGATSGLLPSGGDVALGSGGVTLETESYTGFTGPGSFGSGTMEFANGGTGDQVELAADIDDLFVPAGYVSGTSLSDSFTFDDATFASLGLTPGTYTYTWDTAAGVPVDSFVINIGAVAVPEPLTLSLFGAGLIGAAAMRRRKAK